MDIGHHHAADDTDDVGKENHQRQGDHHGNHPWQHQEPVRLEAHDAHGVDFLGDFHHADLRRVGRARAARHHDGRNQGRQLAGHGNGDHVHHEDVRPELLQLHRALVGYDHADEKAGQGDDGQGPHAGFLNVLHDGAPAELPGLYQQQQQNDEVLSQKGKEGHQVPPGGGCRLPELHQGDQQAGTQGGAPRRHRGEIGCNHPPQLLLVGREAGHFDLISLAAQPIQGAQEQHHAAGIHCGDL